MYNSVQTDTIGAVRNLCMERARQLTEEIAKAQQQEAVCAAERLRFQDEFANIERVLRAIDGPPTVNPLDVDLPMQQYPHPPMGMMGGGPTRRP